MPSPKDVIGLAGCGAMGLPMARNLRRAGFDVWGFDVRPLDEFGDFSERMVPDPQDFAARCSIVISVVRDLAQTEDLLFDSQAILNNAPPIELLVISSTLSPRHLVPLRRRVPETIAMVDAPMSGAPFAAEDATLSFMLGGDQKDLERLQPMLDAMGRVCHPMGAFGAGMTAKVLNNFVAASSIVAVRKVLDWAAELGVEPEKLLTLMHDSSGQTWFGSNIDRIDWWDEAYDPENTIGILEKDVSCELDGAAVDSNDPFGAAVKAALKGMPPPKPQ
ncbi:MAG: NAD(P)-dependent oxidoreductase [Methyloligellaceae bacterium]